MSKILPRVFSFLNSHPCISAFGICSVFHTPSATIFYCPKKQCNDQFYLIRLSIVSLTKRRTRYKPPPGLKITGSAQYQTVYAQKLILYHSVKHTKNAGSFRSRRPLWNIICKIISEFISPSDLFPVHITPAGFLPDWRIPLHYDLTDRLVPLSELSHHPEYILQPCHR